MSVHPLAGKPAPPELLIDVAQLERDYYERWPDLSAPDQLVSFGTSGHRGTALHGSTGSNPSVANISPSGGGRPVRGLEQQGIKCQTQTPAAPETVATVCCSKSFDQ